MYSYKLFLVISNCFSFKPIEKISRPPALISEKMFSPISSNKFGASKRIEQDKFLVFESTWNCDMNYSAVHSRQTHISQRVSRTCPSLEHTNMKGGPVELLNPDTICIAHEGLLFNLACPRCACLRFITSLHWWRDSTCSQPVVSRQCRSE